ERRQRVDLGAPLERVDLDVLVGAVCEVEPAGAVAVCGHSEAGVEADLEQPRTELEAQLPILDLGDRRRKRPAERRLGGDAGRGFALEDIDLDIVAVAAQAGANLPEPVALPG